MAAVRLDGIETFPCYDPVSQLVYSAGRDRVSRVWVAGELLVQDGSLVRPDPGALEKTIAVWQNKLLI